MCACDGTSEGTQLEDLSELELLSEHEGLSKYLRPKTEEEMRTHSAKRRLKRRKKSVAGGGGAYRELPFWNVQHRKLVKLELNLDEIKYDVGLLAGGFETKRPTKTRRK
mmetsp:Transcript_3113/g.9514  ORF Transcript_3113/g.9514 Transcript_3113/m.9514 type:complete len:109 (+) Transcript_3113:153-479(+)